MQIIIYNNHKISSIIHNFSAYNTILVLKYNTSAICAKSIHINSAVIVDIAPMLI